MPSLRFTLLVLFFACGSQSLLAQSPDEIRYFDIQNEETSKDSAYQIYSYYFTDESRNKGKIATHSAKGILVSEIDYLDIKKGLIHGFKLTYDSLGRLKAKETYRNDKKNGLMESYFPNGQKRRQEEYEDDVRIAGQCFTSTGVDTTFYEYETMPHFPGGDAKLLEFIIKNLTYPKKAMRNNIHGKVVVTYVIRSDGQIDKIQVIKSVHEILDQEAIRVVELMRSQYIWVPGKQDGEAINVQYNLPFNFSFR